MESTLKQTTNTFRSDPDGDVVEKLIIGGRMYFIMENVLKSGLLDDLEGESSPVSVTSLCDKHSYNLDVLQRVLDTLQSMGLVTKTKANGTWQYANSPVASKYLTKRSHFDRGIAFSGERGFVDALLSKLPAVLRNGSPSSAMNFFSSEKDMPIRTEGFDNTVLNNNAKLANVNLNELNRTPQAAQPNKNIRDESQTTPKHFLKIMDSMYYASQQVIPRLFDLNGHETVVDLGGGSGYMAKIFADHYPQMSFQVFELPHVARLAQMEFGAHWDSYSAQRISFVGGDFFKDDLPPADLYIAAHVLHSWAESQLHVLLDKIFTSLPPGGELLILEKLLAEDKDGPLIGMSLDLLMAVIGQGKERSASEYRSLLERHGFTNIRMQTIQGENIFDAILATKPAV